MIWSSFTVYEGVHELVVNWIVFYLFRTIVWNGFLMKFSSTFDLIALTMLNVWKHGWKDWACMLHDMHEWCGSDREKESKKNACYNILMHESLG